MYGVMVKLSESRNSNMAGPVNFATATEREQYVNGPDSIIFWYHFVEEDDWHLWRRGGAWKRTQQPAAADKVPDPPEITPDDRRW